MHRTVNDRQRRANLVADLIALSNALEQMELHDEPAPADPSLCEEFAERLLTRTLTNNKHDGRLLRLASCEPETMSAAERQAADAFGRPFLDCVQFLIVSAVALRAASYCYRCDTAGRTDAETALDFRALHLALAATVSTLAALVTHHVVGSVTLPPFREVADLETANGVA